MELTKRALRPVSGCVRTIGCIASSVGRDDDPLADNLAEDVVTVRETLRIAREATARAGVESQKQDALAKKKHRPRRQHHFDYAVFA